MRNRNFNSLIIRVIVGIISVLYVLFLYLDFYDVKVFISTHYIKYFCILLCFLLSILSTKYSRIDRVNSRDILLLRLAMFITVIADLCLVIFDFYILGVVCFSLVQITYSVRHTTKKSKVTIINFFIIFMCIVFLYMITSLFIKQINILLPISMFYFICLIFSVSKAIRIWENDLFLPASKYMIVFGMILFLLCDLCVGLSNATALLPLTIYSIIKIQQISRFLIWFFYLPSQVLLALSGNNEV